MSTDWSLRIRQIHRWTSIAFTLAVVANFVQMGLFGPEDPPGPVTYSPLPPLFLLLATGLYLFALPYYARWRDRRARE